MEFSKFAAVSALLLSSPAWAQNATVVATGLQAPFKLALTPAGNLLVSEAGDGANKARISLVTRGGERRSLMEGLPAGASNGGDNALIGPTGLAYRNRTLYMAIAEGDDVRNGPTPGSVTLNPQGVSSPIFASVLRVQFSADADSITAPFLLQRADHDTIADGVDLNLDNAAGQRATISLLAKFPPASPDSNTTWRHSDPFALTIDPAQPDTLYIADAGQNTVLRMNATSGRYQVVSRFAQYVNPTRVGSPMVDAVPTGVAVFGGQLIVSTLSGFPFVPGVAQVRIVDTATRQNTPWIVGLTSLTDLAWRSTPAGAWQFFVLSYSNNQRGTPLGPGQLLQYDSPEGTLIADGLVTPTGIVVDPASGDVFIAENTVGRISRVAAK